MSSSIMIPKRKATKHKQRTSTSFATTPESRSDQFSLPSTSGSSSYSRHTTSSPSSSLSSSSAYGTPDIKRRRESLMSATFSHAEHTVVHVGGATEESCMRLITCVKASQGFDWNQEIFFPSYVDFGLGGLERGECAVVDVVVSEEEGRGMVPE
ncbi:hypothetical protein BDW02DRAFT_568473 [Decorospora gaudefroyi]|uniref:Uncharacterized protein n=1 Tax=Decorospora gaudefroyi TaxID=184978 RepID=A0A6A5KCI2_9PLEO|nr:hypothetical protein BDW02DRAFT_568473 [Decorospora gaudefroyi]